MKIICVSTLFNYIILQMLVDPTGKFQSLVSELIVEDKYMRALQAGLRTYNIRQFKVQELKPHNILLTYYQISSRFYDLVLASNSNSWHENQLKIFIWLIIGFCYLKKLSILQFHQQDWLFFSQIFKSQTPQALEYQALLIVKKKNKPVKWSREEINLLKSILRQNKRNNMWKETARNLYLYSQKKYFRTAKQCRQFWINHLDPIPIKSSWSTSQDIQLIQLTFLLNKKWSKISKQFGGRRTQHMVKNRYHSLYHSQLKKLPTFENVKEKNLMMALRQKLKDINQQSEVKFEQPIRTSTDLQGSLQQKQINYENQEQNQSYNSLYYDCLKNKEDQQIENFQPSHQANTMKVEEPHGHNILGTPEPLPQNEDYLDLSRYYGEEENFQLNRNQDSFLLLQ